MPYCIGKIDLSHSIFFLFFLNKKCYLLVPLVDQLVRSADELEVVVAHELGGDLGSKQPASPAGGHGPVLNLV